MAVESGGFMVEGVDWHTAASREIRADRMPGALVRIGIRSATITCLKCNESWKAMKGARPGQLLPIVGNQVPMECPHCQNRGAIKLGDLA